MKPNCRLPRNFHKTFIPERRYIRAILQFASAGKTGDILTIAKETGIPTGVSSGKVMPAIDYARGMGLIKLLEESKRNSVKKPQLTSFGRIVLLEDPFLKEPETQWVAHLNLCGALRGADVWHQIFFLGTQTLGKKFKKGQLDNYLQNIYGTHNKNLIGPMIRMYEDPASFAVCGALNENQGTIHRKTGPVSDSFSWGYGAWILKAIETYFPGESQVTITDLDRTAGWRTIPGWGIDESQQVLKMLENNGILTVERHMNPWILQRSETSNKIWKKFYDGLV